MALGRWDLHRWIVYEIYRPCRRGTARAGVTSRARTFPIRGRIHVSLHGASPQRDPHRIRRREGFGANVKVAGAIRRGGEGTTRSVEDNHRDVGRGLLGGSVHEHGARNAECRVGGRHAALLMAKEARLAGTMQRPWGNSGILRPQGCDRLIAKGISARGRCQSICGRKTGKGHRGAHVHEPSFGVASIQTTSRRLPAPSPE